MKKRGKSFANELIEFVKSNWQIIVIIVVILVVVSMLN